MSAIFLFPVHFMGETVKYFTRFRMMTITHAGCVAAGVGRAFNRVCLFVCLFVLALKGKRFELSTPNLVHLYSIAVARHALTQMSKGQRSRLHGYENRHGRTVASDACCYGRFRRGSACRCDCLCFIVSFGFRNFFYPCRMFGLSECLLFVNMSSKY